MDLGLELSFVRDKLQQKTAAADNLEIEVLELGAKLDKSTRDYVRVHSTTPARHTILSLYWQCLFVECC